jgi:hypothetical protein
MHGDDGTFSDGSDVEDVAKLMPVVLSFDRKRNGDGRRQLGALNLTEELVARMRPGTPDEFAESLTPDQHVFQRGEEGLFPVHEGSTVAGLARDGKTQAFIGLAAAERLGLCVGGLPSSEPGLATLIATAEDSRRQYLRKINAAAHAASERGGTGAGDKVRSGIVVLDLGDESLAHVRALVKLEDRQPCVGPIVNALVEAIAVRQEQLGLRFGQVYFETASTLNEADESNPALRTLALAVRQVARKCQVASVISHHLSQAAIPNVRDLNLSLADIRGGTALVNNLRQCCILVNLGSSADPFPDNDMRTVLRQVVDDDSPLAERGETVAVLVPLDASKGARPPPIYFRRYRTPYGPALLPIPTPAALDGLSWRRQLQWLRGMRADVRDTAREAGAKLDVQQVVAIVATLERDKVPATVKAVSTAAGHGADWARPRLDRAVVEGRLRREMRKVARCANPVPIYLSLHQSDDRSATGCLDGGEP